MSCFHVWSDTCDRTVDDLFAVQDEIAMAISEALLGELDLTPITEDRYVASAEAQELYYRGRAQWSRRDAVGIPGAIELFTRAIEARSGYVGAADGGTLVLDEIGDMPVETQPKILRLLEQKCYRAVGEAQERDADIRLIAATNQDLENMVEDKSFRRDLFRRGGDVNL